MTPEQAALIKKAEDSLRAALEVHPLTPKRWPDLEVLFGPRGAVGGCWCMWWRLKRSDFDQKRGSGTKRAFKKIVASGAEPGLLAYVAGRPIGWCAVAPREAYPVLDRSPVLKRVDDQPAWSITCFFIARPYRRQGVTVALLKAAVAYAASHGARIVEGYPVEPKKDSMPEVYAFTGMASAFRKTGFVEVLRRSESRTIMRYYVKA